MPRRWPSRAGSAWPRRRRTRARRRPGSPRRAGLRNPGSRGGGRARGSARWDAASRAAGAGRLLLRCRGRGDCRPPRQLRRILARRVIGFRPALAAASFAACSCLYLSHFSRTAWRSSGGSCSNSRYFSRAARRCSGREARPLLHALLQPGLLLGASSSGSAARCRATCACAGRPACPTRPGSGRGSAAAPGVSSAQAGFCLSARRRGAERPRQSAEGYSEERFSHAWKSSSR